MPVDSLASTSIRRPDSKVLPVNGGNGTRPVRDRRSSISPHLYSEPPRRRTRTSSNDKYGPPRDPADLGTLVLTDIEPTDEVERSSAIQRRDPAQRRSTDDSSQRASNAGGRSRTASTTSDSNIDDSTPVRSRRASHRRSTSEDDRRHSLAQGSGRIRTSSLGKN